MPILTVNTVRQQTDTFRILELHADYACENTGHCCHNGWNVTIPRARLAGLRKELTASGMAVEELSRRFHELPESDNPLIGGLFLKNEAGHCTFVGGEAGCSTCTLQQRLGHEAIPEICQAFPRLTVRTPAGIYLTLSYTCPTAAKLLLKPEGLREVAPRGVFQYKPALVGVGIGDKQAAPQWSGSVHPEWAAFDFFWRWAVEFAARPDLAPSHALYSLGFVVGAIEQHASRLARLEPLVEMLDDVSSQPSTDFTTLCSGQAASTELGVIYMDMLLKQISATQQIPGQLEILWNAKTGSVKDRASLAREYDARVRPRLKEFETIERNYVASRLYANPLCYRAKKLRTGYFANVLSLIALRFGMLARCMEKGEPLDDQICCEAAAIADDLMLHIGTMQTTFINMLDANVETELKNLMRPALF